MIKRHKMSKKTEETIKSFLSYSPEDGLLRWRKAPTGFILAGNRAGRKHQNGHLCVCVDKKEYMAHHVAWLLYYGEMPKTSVFHLNGNKADNRIGNLSLTKGD